MKHFVTLLTISLCAAAHAQTESEPNDNIGEANALPVSTTTSGDIGCANPGGTSADYFAITLPADGTLNFTIPVNNVGTPGSLQFQVFNSGGGLLANATMNSGSTGSHTLECAAAGQYYVQLYRNTSNCYTYSITWSLTQPGIANDAEPNNNAGSALPLTVNDPAEGHVNFLYYADNTDHYVINTSGDGRITLSFEAYALGAGATNGAQLQFFNDGGGLLDNWSADVGGNSIAAQSDHILDCRAAGTYYLSIYSNGPCGTAYRVSYQFTAPLFPNDTEPNNNGAQADALPVLQPNTNTSGHVNFLSYADNTDYFRINSPDQGIITFTMIAESQAPATANGLQMQLFNSGGGLLENWSTAVGGGSDADTTFVSTFCRGAGTYYLLVYANTPCGVSYTMSFTGTAPVYANDVEDNDNGSQADTVAYGAPTDGRIAFYYDDNDDYFAITPTDQGVIHIHLAAENVAAAVSNGMQVQLFNSGGGLLENWSAPVGGNNVPDTITLSTICRGAGLYYVRFYANTPCGVSYRWRWDGTGPVYGNDLEDNDNIGQAQPLGYNTESDGRLAFYYDDGDDYRVITPADDGYLHIHWSAENVGAGDPAGAQLQLFTSGGGLIGNWSVPVGGSSTPASTQIDFPCVSDGLYYLRCYANSSCGISYRIRYDIGPPLFGADPEPNNDLVQAPPIDLDEAGQDGRLSFYYEDNDDYYAYISSGVQQTQVITLAENVGAPGTMQLQIFNSGGGLLYNASHDVGGGGVAASDTSIFGPFDPGTCYLRLFSNGICGVSYRILCNDDDGDGVCNGLETGTADLLTAGSQVIASPNPSADGLFTVLAGGLNMARVEVFNAHGALVLQQRPNGARTLLDLSHLPPGLYSARVLVENGHSAHLRLIRGE